MDDFIKSKGKHSQKPFGVPVPSSVLYTRGWLGLNCNGKDIENNVHWFTLYYSLSQEKNLSPSPVPSRAYPVILCCTKANCALLCYPRLYCHPTTRTVHHYLLTSTNDNATGQRQRIKPGILVAHSAKERSHWGVSDSVVLFHTHILRLALLLSNKECTQLIKANPIVCFPV